MRLPDELPAPHLLLVEPERAALEVLDVALGLAQGAIVAAHPGWARCECTTHPHSGRCAQAGLIGCMAYELQEAIVDYLSGQATDAEEP